MALSFLFDIDHILKNTSHKDKLPVILKKDKVKGNSLFANRDLEAGETLAYYKMKVYKSLDSSVDISTPMKTLKKECEKLKIDITNKSPTFYQHKKSLIKEIEKKSPMLSLHGKKIIPPFYDMYHFTIYKKNGDEYKNFVGDLYKGSLPPPKNNVPYWAYFSNEPSGKQVYNCEIDIQLDENYKKQNRTTLKEGDTVVYSLLSTKPIKKGEEIVWCYGSSYNRNYEINKKSCK
jgi:hypothetical protein